MKTYSSMIFQLSNLLSLARIFLLIPFYFLYLEFKESGEPLYHYAAIFVGLFAAYTDYLDGYFARKLNQISDLGKILDPIADKIAIAFFAILFMVYADFPAWIVYIMLGRDVLIMIGAGFLMNKIDEIPSSEWPGKVTTCVLALLFLVYLLEWDAPKVLLEISSMICIAYSLLDYILKFIRLKSKI